MPGLWVHHFVVTSSFCGHDISQCAIISQGTAHMLHDIWTFWVQISLYFEYMFHLYYHCVCTDYLGIFGSVLIRLVYIIVCESSDCYDDVMTRKRSIRYSPFVRGIHQDSPHKGPVTRALQFSDVSLNKWLNNQLIYQWFETPWRPYDVTIMSFSFLFSPSAAGGRDVWYGSRPFRTHRDHGELCGKWVYCLAQSFLS